MLKISQDQLPQSILSYIAFRVAFLETMERMTWTVQFETATEDRFGYLTEVPFLRAVPPHVQLDLLATCWWKHLSVDEHPATLVDESIVYSVCEMTARLVEEDPTLVQRFLSAGPLAAELKIDHQLASELRALHLKLANDGDFLLIGQFSDLPPEEAAALKEKFGFDQSRAECMFDLLARWQISPNFQSRIEHLLSASEIQQAFDLMQFKMTRSWLSH